jgi:CBS domain-containing protein
VQVTGALAHLRVPAVMPPQPVTAPPDVTVAHFLEAYLFRYRFSSFPLVEDGHPVGLVTLERINSVPPAARDTVRLRDVAGSRAAPPAARSSWPTASWSESCRCPT